ncbi:TrmH family RNA methyltransferase [Actinotignum sp. SLA_B059]|uniref:TrmH family RNA methyltransferase n=1 Tax=Actinotignum sp. SLA_B059 TaxID=3083287 RepID=UPI002A7F6BF6|nr:TrmH family RNA methyltransferase [Actinotignum sp. SLA_B059]MDY5127629.1 TrmH family RNA methyltransferase [Actinotignum sp. SLA_B059]
MPAGEVASAVDAAPAAGAGELAGAGEGVELPAHRIPEPGGSPYGEKRTVGVGPHPLPWPEDPRLDPQLLTEGDHRNVVDKYRYWSVEAIKADMASRAVSAHIAIENLQHDLNIGSIVRSANAFNFGGVHIVGRHKWNKRGALVTDRYLTMYYHPTPAELEEWAREHEYQLIAIDNQEGAVPLEQSELPKNCLLVFGQESAGISPDLLERCDGAVEITQDGSTRSLNVAAAAAIAMHWWVAQHARRQAAPRSH